MITYSHHYSILFCRVNCHYGTLLGKKHNTLQHHFCCSFLETLTAASFPGLKTILQTWMSASFGAQQNHFCTDYSWCYFILKLFLWLKFMLKKNHKYWKMLPVPIINYVIAFSPRDRPIIFPLKHSSYERLL